MARKRPLTIRDRLAFVSAMHRYIQAHKGDPLGEGWQFLLTEWWIEREPNSKQMTAHMRRSNIKRWRKIDKGAFLTLWEQEKNDPTLTKRYRREDLLRYVNQNPSYDPSKLIRVKGLTSREWRVALAPLMSERSELQNDSPFEAEYLMILRKLRLNGGLLPKDVKTLKDWLPNLDLASDAVVIPKLLQQFGISRAPEES